MISRTSMGGFMIAIFIILNSIDFNHPFLITSKVIEFHKKYDSYIMTIYN